MLKDNFNVTLKLKWYSIFNRDRRINLNFEEATIEQTLEFMQNIEKADFWSIKFIYEFFRKNSNWKINKKIFVKYISNNLEQILGILKKTYVKGVFLEEKAKKTEEKTEKSENLAVDEFLTDLGRLLAFLSEKMSIDPNGILKTYTWRQLNFWTSHYIYLEREKTKEGQKINKKEENKKFTEKHEKEIKESLARLEKYLKK